MISSSAMRSLLLGVGGPEPERGRLADTLKIRLPLGAASRIPGGQVVAVEHVLSALGAEEAGEIRERDEALLRFRVEGRPPARVLFRPEEVHARSEEPVAPARGPEPVVEVADHGG